MKAIITAAAVALLLTGCSAESDTADKDKPSATQTAAATTPAKTAPAAKPSSTADERKIRAYLRENFGGEYGPATSWYRYIKSVRIDFETIKAKTNLYDDSDASEPARAICSALLGAIPDLDDPMAGAEVQDKSGGKIIECQPG